MRLVYPGKYHPYQRESHQHLAPFRRRFQHETHDDLYQATAGCQTQHDACAKRGKACDAALEPKTCRFHRDLARKSTLAAALAAGRLRCEKPARLPCLAGQLTAPICIRVCGPVWFCRTACRSRHTSWLRPPGIWSCRRPRQFACLLRGGQLRLPCHRNQRGRD